MGRVSCLLVGLIAGASVLCLQGQVSAADPLTPAEMRAISGGSYIYLEQDEHCEATPCPQFPTIVCEPYDPAGGEATARKTDISMQDYPTCKPPKGAHKWCQLGGYDYDQQQWVPTVVCRAIMYFRLEDLNCTGTPFGTIVNENAGCIEQDHTQIAGACPQRPAGIHLAETIRTGAGSRRAMAGSPRAQL